jgi:hypothetical protein
MPDDEWEEVSRDIPAKDEPFINKYLLGRDALIDQEKKQRSGRYPSFLQNLTLTGCSQIMDSGNPSPPCPKKPARLSVEFEMRNSAQCGPRNSRTASRRKLALMYTLE